WRRKARRAHARHPQRSALPARLPRPDPLRAGWHGARGRRAPQRRARRAADAPLRRPRLRRARGRAQPPGRLPRRIFELLRTPLWFSGGDIALRPTVEELGPDSPNNPLCQKIHQILDAIIEDNRGCWPVIARFALEGRYEHQSQTVALPAG